MPFTRAGWGAASSLHCTAAAATTAAGATLVVAVSVAAAAAGRHYAYDATA